MTKKSKSKTKQLSEILKKTKKNAKKLRDKVQQLKKEQNKRNEIPPIDLDNFKEPKKKNAEQVVIHFSMVSVAKATLVVIGLGLLAWFLYDIQQILVLIFVALFLAAALDSVVDRLQEKGVPRAASVLGIYFLFFILLVVFISTLIPLLAQQTQELARTLSQLVSNLTQREDLWQLPYTEPIRNWVEDFLTEIDQDTVVSNLETSLEALAKQMQGIAGNTWGAIKIVFDSIFNAILVMVLTFFMIVDEKAIENFLISLFPSKHTQYIIAKSEAVKAKIGYWMRGQLQLMVIMAVITYIVLVMLGVEYALTLAIIAGITELLPVVGPIIAMLPALLVGLNQSASMALWILIAYIVIQQLEGNIIVPIVMKKAVGLNPIIIVIAMLIGFHFLSVLGMIIAVPVATAVSIFITDYAKRSK
jgi:predicted PurR-regulated permease PerM